MPGPESQPARRMEGAPIVTPAERAEFLRDQADPANIDRRIAKEARNNGVHPNRRSPVERALGKGK